MLRPVARVVAATVATAAVLLATATPALAHEVRKVGAYQLTVGWQHEPAYAGTENAVQVFVHDATGSPVDDLGTPVSLKVQVVYGSATSPYLELEPSFDADTGLGTHGEFDAAITPTQPGNYTFHFTGSIRGQRIDERFTSSPSTFAPVASPSSAEFPTKVPSPAEQAAAITRLQDQVAASSSSADSAKSAATAATVVAVVAVVVALVAGGIALAALRSRRRDGH
jgi:hypothetical protein